MEEMKLLMLFLLMCLTSCRSHEMSYGEDEVDQLPVFQTREKDFSSYISKNFQLPEDYGENGIYGHVVIHFVVEKNGDLSHFKVLKSAYPNFDRQFIRMLKKMPKWNPGIKNGRAVRTRYAVVYFVGRTINVDANIRKRPINRLQ